MIVLDASAVVDWLLGAKAAAAIAARALGGDETLHAPHLLDVEAASALRRAASKGEIAAARGREALSDLADLPIRRWPHDGLLPRVWELRDALSAYDATYVALAEILGATLVTCDRRLAGSKGHGAAIWTP